MTMLAMTVLAAVTAVGGTGRAEWMRGSVGIGVHWTPCCGVADGGEVSFEKAIEEFDAERFAEELKEAGARHVIFTTAHYLQRLAMPNAALDRIVPGRTSKRDLLGDIIRECGKRGIRFIAYYNHSCNSDSAPEVEWASQCKCPCRGTEGCIEPFASNVCSIVECMSVRYGKGISGWWFDSPYSVDSSGPHVACRGKWRFPWQRLMAAARKGNPDAAVTINGGIGCRFQYAEGEDYYSGEAVRLDEPFAPAADPKLVDTRWICVDDPQWVMSGARGFVPLRFSEDELRAYAKEHVGAGRMVTFNVLIDRRGHFSPVLRQLAGLMKDATSASRTYDVAAYVWPAYQPEPRWAELGIFKAGKGEWQNVWEAVPKWEGHVQPLKPLWGYENEADPKVVEKKIDAAVSHGVNVFIYDWYWYGGRPFLEDALNKGFLGAKNNGKMKFFVMWANHHVNWLWDNTTADKRWGAPRKDWLGFVTDEEFRTKLVPRWISQYFGKSNYYRIGGKPVLMIYEVGTFVQGVGGVEKAAAAIAFLRAEAVKAGFGGVHLMACDFGVKPEWVKALGIDSATIYNFVHWSSPAGNPDYADWAKRGADRFDAAKRELGLAAYFPHASVGWDTNPRYPKGSVQPTAINSTPAKFEQVLRRAKAWSDANPQLGMPKLFTVNSWNEWTEGSYLEPDTINGFGYLDAVRRVVE